MGDFPGLSGWALYLNTSIINREAEGDLAEEEKVM